MKGLDFDPATGKLTFMDGARNALVAPDGTLINLLPTPYVLNDQNAVFPDCTKGRMFTHIWRYVRPPASFSGNEAGRCFITALPQEWSLVTALADAPDDTDIFAAQIRLLRTAAPSHNWMGTAINKMVPENVWIPLTGSMIVEANFGFIRALSVYIDDDSGSPTYRKLVMHQQQSVSVAPGGYGGFGYSYASFSNPGNFDTGNSGETVSDGTNGFPIYYPGDTGAPHYKARLIDISEASPFAAVWIPPTTYRRTGSSPPSLSDPTNFSSTWQIDIVGKFGRRS